MTDPETCVGALVRSREVAAAEGEELLPGQHYLVTMYRHDGLRAVVQVDQLAHVAELLLSLGEIHVTVKGSEAEVQALHALTATGTNTSIQ